MEIRRNPVPSLEPKTAHKVHSTPRAVEKAKPRERAAEITGARKADIFTERVTLQISPEMRDQVERIARELQRSKTSKKERITGDTVMRVAIRLITERFELKPCEGPNDEEELFECIEKALTTK